MKKTIFTGSLLLITSICVLLSCTKDLQDPNPVFQGYGSSTSGTTTLGTGGNTTGSTTSSTGGSTTTSGTGQINIWNSNPSVGTITVYVNGVYEGQITSSTTTCPYTSCSIYYTSSTQAISESPGTYTISYTATAGTYTSTNVVNVSSGSCTMIHLY